jgi:hypothetical protein
VNRNPLRVKRIRHREVFVFLDAFNYDTPLPSNYPAYCPLAARLDSGATTTLLTRASAESLELDPRLGEETGLEPLGGKVLPVKKYEIEVHVGKRHYRIPACVRLGPDGDFWDDREDPDAHDILGMDGVLRQNMICLTPQAVYFFPYDGPPAPAQPPHA